MNNLYDRVYEVVESVYDKQTQVDDAVLIILDEIEGAAQTSGLGDGPDVQGEPVGEAGSLHGAKGFTAVVFESRKVPVGTKLYATPQPATEQRPDVTQLVEALERFVEAWTDCQQQPVHAEEFEILTDICEDSLKALAAHHKQEVRHD